MNGPDDNLLERELELAQLRERINALRGAQACGTCVLLSAEAGGGKTSLLAEAARLVDRDVEWMWGACEPMLSPQPLGALADLLDHLPPSLAAAVLSGRHTTEVLTGMLTLLRERREPMVLVIDDVQWADGATLDLLRYLGRRIAGTRALLVLSYRSDALAVDSALQAVIGSLPSSHCLRMPLAPLSPAAVAKMAQRAGRSAHGLHEVTQGNPFFVTELLAGDAQILPASMRDAVLARAAALPPEARDLLELASVAPVQIDVEVLDAVVDDARGAIERCIATGLLQLDGVAVCFRHELARRAIEASLSPGRAAALHAAVFDASSVRGAPVVRLVHHAAHAGLTATVLALSPQAAREAAKAGAHRQAAALYELALEQAANLPPSEQAKLYVAHAEECRHLARIDDAQASYRAALALKRQLGDRLGEGLVLCDLAGSMEYHGGAQAALPYAQAAIDLLEAAGARQELAVAYAQMAHLHLPDLTAQAAIEWGTKALAMLEGLDGAEECLAFALNRTATARLRSQDLPELWAMMERSRDISLAHGFDSHAAGAFLNTATFALVYRRYAEVESACDQGLAFCEARDIDVYLAPLHHRRCHALLETGRWDAAEALVAKLRQEPAPSAASLKQTTLLQNLIDLRRGRKRAEPYWTEMIEGRYALEVGPWYAPNAVMSCEAAWLRGEDAQVRRIAMSAFAVGADSGEGWRLGQLACWLKRSGGEPPRGPDALPAPCQLELDGDVRGAAQAWAALGCRYQQALALLHGDEADLRAALALLDELGAIPAASIVRRRLHALGARAVPRGRNARTRVDPLGLTARERDVLDLLKQQLTNRAIADRLHRSERTVEKHVAALLGKLGVTSRTEAASLGDAEKK